PRDRTFDRDPAGGRRAAGRLRAPADPVLYARGHADHLGTEPRLHLDGDLAMRCRSLFVAGALLALSGGLAAVAETPEQGRSNQKPQPWPMETIQGFHVVLVVGETQAGEAPSTQQLPEGAARALNDMREFLPYKHYRVLDAQWSSCCSGPQSRLSGRLQGVLGVPGPDGAVKLVHRPYNFHLTARSAAIGIQTRFVLVAQDARASHSGDH